MKIIGLITEYNPFHNGHKYHIEKALEKSGADKAIAIMSGNYVQRGTPAIMPKHLRTKAALQNGVSAVLELPVPYATGSAEYFARGAVSLLASLGCIDGFCFGSECGDISTLSEIAEVAASEPFEYRHLLQNYLKEGLTFPSARQKALAAYMKSEKVNAILAQPNNILGIEYLKANLQLNARLTPYTIKRFGADYHDAELHAHCSSASAIRKLLAYPKDTLPPLNSHVPDSSIQLFNENYRLRYPISADDFSLLLKYKLLSETKTSLTRFADVTEDLANRVYRQLNAFVSFEQFCDLLKTKEITYTRIRRILLHIILDITKKDMQTYGDHYYHGYARLLGFCQKDTSVLRTIKKCSQIPLLTKLTNTETLEPFAAHMLEKEIYANNLYESVITQKYKTSFINEYTQEIVRV